MKNRTLRWENEFTEAEGEEMKKGETLAVQTGGYPVYDSMDNTTNALRHYKTFVCLELGWEGVESCNITDCPQRARCEVQEARE